MGTVYKPKRSKAWWIDFRDANGDRVRKRVSESKKIAQEALREAERHRDRVRGGLETTVSNDAAVADIWRDFRASLVGDGLAPDTLRQADTYVPTFFEAISAVKVSDVTLDKADGYKEERQRQKGETSKGASPRTVNIALSWAKRMLRWAVDHAKIGSNPLERVRFVKRRPVHERRALTVDECGRLLAKSPGRYRPLWALYLCTGMRKSEAVHLTWGNVDLGRRTIRLEAESTKTRTERLCFFGPQLETMLRQLGPGEPDALVFPTERGTPRVNNLRRAFRACCKTAEIDLTGVDLHALRATFATLVMETGADLKTAQVLIGHGGASGILLLDKYAKPRMLRLHRAAEAVEGLIWASYGQALAEMETQPKTARKVG